MLHHVDLFGFQAHVSSPASFNVSTRHLVVFHQAFNMTGGEKVWMCVRHLQEDIKALHMASKEDDKKDDDNDGIPDVKQASLTSFVVGLFYR